MHIAIVGKGRMGHALAISAQSAGHEVTILTRKSAKTEAHQIARNLQSVSDWASFDVVVLAFHKRVASIDELAADPDLAALKFIPVSVPILSVVMEPDPMVITNFLSDHKVSHFLTTPAAEKPGGLAVHMESSSDKAALQAAFPNLTWRRATDSETYRRLGFIMVSSAMAAAAIGHHLQRLNPPFNVEDWDILACAVSDISRLLDVTDGDGLKAFGLVATPGGFTEQIHNALFKQAWKNNSST